ncbi:hypothetical protein ACLOJK_016053 [Asimina triloba]
MLVGGTLGPIALLLTWVLKKHLSSCGRGENASHLVDGAAAQCNVGAEQDHQGDCGL